MPSNENNKHKQHHQQQQPQLQQHYHQQQHQHQHQQRLHSRSLSNAFGRCKCPVKCFNWLQLVFAIISLEIAADCGYIAAAAAVITPLTPVSTLSVTVAPPAPTAPPAVAASTSATFISDNIDSDDNDADNVLSAIPSRNGNRNGNGRGGNADDEQRPRGSQRIAFAPLDKEVVDRLIKQWAPIVWLAPEEKFMPLGVDEFLNHVHPMDKGKGIIPGMPIGDTSKKAYLVTNAEIEELLENDSSFIYGRNPNEAPVPIYAVASLCNEPTTPPPQQSLPPSAINSNVKPQIPPKMYGEQNNHYAPIISQTMQNPQKLPTPLSSTRGPYIPVSIDPLEVRNDTVRRSSRLYPVFKRVRRQATHIVDATYVPLSPPSMPPLLLNLPPKAMTKPYNLVMGETRVGFGVSAVDGIEIDTPTAPAATTDAPDNTNTNVNNFIANLADNVKFSIPNNELDNNIDIDNNFNELPTAPQHPAMHNGDKHKKVPGFHVTYWMFYPYSQGKTMCTLSLGPLGSIPFPAVYGFCLGRRKDIGSHIGDWEHMSLYFTGEAEPEAMYVSAHDAGAYYSYNRLTGSFEFKKQETRKGILQRPNFPKTVTTFNSHPVLFAAKGSHGLWTAPGKHRFVKVARLYDINGFGTPWNTWKAVEITYENLKSYGRSLIPSWLSFKGKWGNPKSKCHPFRRIGLNFCEYTDGPTGIPLKEPHFQCGAPTYR